jgi:hypothetical protein
LSAVRSAIRISAAGPRAVSSGARPPATRAPSSDVALDGDARIDQREHRGRDVEAEHGERDARVHDRDRGGCRRAPTVAAVVTSPRPRSSSSARSIRRRT